MSSIPRSLGLYCCNIALDHQGELADSKPGWHCQEGRLCSWFRVPHHAAGSCTKVSANCHSVQTNMSWLTQRTLLEGYNTMTVLHSGRFPLLFFLGQDTLTGRKHMKHLLRWWCLDHQSMSCHIFSLNEHVSTTVKHLDVCICNNC